MYQKHIESNKVILVLILNHNDTKNIFQRNNLW